MVVVVPGARRRDPEASSKASRNGTGRRGVCDGEKEHRYLAIRIRVRELGKRGEARGAGEAGERRGVKGRREQQRSVSRTSDEENRALVSAG